MKRYWKIVVGAMLVCTVFFFSGCDYYTAVLGEVRARIQAAQTGEDGPDRKYGTETEPYEWEWPGEENVLKYGNLGASTSIWTCGLHIALPDGEEIYFESKPLLGDRYIRVAYLDGGRCRYAFHKQVDPAVLDPLEWVLEDYHIRDWGGFGDSSGEDVFLTVDYGDDYVMESDVPARYAGFSQTLVDVLKNIAEPHLDGMPQAAQSTPDIRDVRQIEYSLGPVGTTLTVDDDGVFGRQTLDGSKGLTLEKELDGGAWNDILGICRQYHFGMDMPELQTAWKWEMLTLTDVGGEEYVYYVPEDFVKEIGSVVDGQDGESWRGAEGVPAVRYLRMKDQQGKDIASVTLASSAADMPEAIYREFGGDDSPAIIWYQYHDGEWEGMTGYLLWDSEMQLLSMMAYEYGLADIAPEPGVEDVYDSESKHVPDDYAYYSLSIEYENGSTVETQFSATSAEFQEFRELLHKFFGYWV